MVTTEQKNITVVYNGKRLPVYYDANIGAWRWARYEGDKFPSHGFTTRDEAMKVATAYAAPLR